MAKLHKQIEIFAERLPVDSGQLSVLSCAGIGDALWTYSKWWKVCQERPVTFWFPEGEPHRAGPLCQLWGVRYGYMPNLTTQMVWDYHDEKGDPEIPDSGGVLIVSPNRHLESGKRIERWYPELPFRNPAPTSNVTTYKLEVGTPQYVVVSMGAHDYMEGNLLPGIWARILKRIEATIAPVLLIASHRSENLTNLVLKQFDPTLAPAMYVPLPELIPVIARSKGLIGTASGITILSTYMGIPTLHGYPRWLKHLPNMWEQEGHISDSCFVDELEMAVNDNFFSNIIARRDRSGRGDNAADTQFLPPVHDTGSNGHYPGDAKELVGKSLSISEVLSTEG